MDMKAHVKRGKSDTIDAEVNCEAVTRPTQAVGYLVCGRLALAIAGTPFTVTAGASFRIKGESYRWSNPYDTPAVAIWVIAPPVY